MGNSAKIVLLGLVVFFSSCNLTRQYVNRSEKKYDKWGRSSWVSELDSASIYWRKIGDGDKKILLVHGFGPVPQVQWQKLVEELYQDYTVYVPDLIYFGKSTSTSNNYDPRFLSRKLIESFEKYEKGNYYLVGVSYGGLIAAISANAIPEKVNGLILIDALSRNMDRASSDSLANSYGYKNVSQMLIPENGNALKTLFKMTFYKPPKYPAFLLNKPAQQLYNDQKEQKIGLMEYLYKHETEIKKWDFNYQGPVCIIWGEEDLLIPMRDGYLIKEQYENSEIKIIPKAAHAVNMENAKEVAGFTRELLEENE